MGKRSEHRGDLPVFIGDELVDSVDGNTACAASVRADVRRRTASAAGEVDVGAAAESASSKAIVAATDQYAGDTAEGTGLRVASTPVVARRAEGADRPCGDGGLLVAAPVDASVRKPGAAWVAEEDSADSAAARAVAEAPADGAHPFEGVAAVADAWFTVLPPLGELRQLAAFAAELGRSGVAARAEWPVGGVGLDWAYGAAADALTVGVTGATAAESDQ